ALRRRAYALDRMAEEGFIKPDAAAAAKARPIATSGAPVGALTVAPYFIETVRQQLQERYGAKAIYESGLTVRTGLDPLLQRTANEALDPGSRPLDRCGAEREP